MKQYFFTREKTFVECETIEDTPFRRRIKILEGDKKNKVVSVHPEGVAWGSLYPRIFKAIRKPSKFLVFKGRVLIEPDAVIHPDAIPKMNAHYRFQPFLKDVIDSVHAKESILLTGGTGVGKTTHISQAASRINQPLLRINFNGETRMSDLIGKVSVIGGETKFTYGVLPEAMKKGYWLLLDELDFADPAVLSLLHPVLEDDAMLVLKENNGEIIRPHSNFRLFATANSIGAMSDRAAAYAGTNQMNEAFLDRWQVVFVDNLAPKEEMRILKGEVPGLKTKWNRQIVEFANKARAKSMDEGVEFSGDNFSTRKTIAWAKKTALHRSPVIGAKLAWLDKIPNDEQNAMMRILTTMFGGNQKRVKNPLKVNKTSVGNLSTFASINTVKRGRGRPAKVKI